LCFGDKKCYHRQGARPFKTFDIWDKAKGFSEVIVSSWAQGENRGNTLEMVKDKLKRVKLDLESGG